jgi:vacuolar-type H+-ATPase subunit I/STV1
VTGYTNIQLLIYNNYLTLPILFFGIFLTGEYNRLYIYLNNEYNENKVTFYHILLYLVLYGIVCSILTSSFFISNEKNSSLLTKLLSNSRAIFVAVFLNIFDKKKNKLNGTILFGLIIATLGSIFINLESILKNIHTERNNVKDEVKVHNKKNNVNINEEAVKIIDMENKN